MIILPGPDVVTYTDTIVSIDGLLLGLEIDGVAWIYTNLKGWTLGGGVDSSDAPRPSQHGNFAGPTYRRGRVISIEGVCVADTAALAEQASDALAALLADGSTGSFMVSNSRRTLTAPVSLSDTPLDEWMDDLAFTWSLQFKTTDWRKYGETQSADSGLPGGGTGLAYSLAYPLDYGDPGDAGRLIFTNSGTAPTEPTFTVTGPLLNGFDITRVETGQRLRYEHTVGTTLTVDCAAGTVMEAGERRERYLTVREWPSVGPGETATFQFSTLGSETHLDAAHLSGQLAPAYP